MRWESDAIILDAFVLYLFIFHNDLIDIKFLNIKKFS